MTHAPSRPSAVARRDTVTELLHGHTVADPYRWLEDGHSPECAAWLENQERLFAEAAPTWPHRAAWRRLLRDAAGVGSSLSPVSSPPLWRRGRRFLLRHEPGRRLPALMVADPGRPSRVLLDPLDFDADGTTTLDAWRPSPGGDLLAYQTTRKGDERPRLRVLDVATGTPVGASLSPGRSTPVAWLADGTGFFYVSTPEDGAGRRLRLHRIGADPRHDPILFATDLPQFSVTTSPDGRHLMLSAAPGATSGNLLWLVRLPDHPEEGLEPVPVFDGMSEGTRAALKFAPDGGMYAITDAEAPFGRMCAVAATDPHHRAWRTVVEERAGSVLAACVTLTDPATAQTRLLVSHHRHGLSELRLYTAEGTLLADIAPPGAGHVSRLTAPPEGGASAWFSYTDFTTPPAVHRFDLPERRCVPEPPEGFPASPDVAGDTATVRRGAAGHRPVVEQIVYASHDGTPVRMHLLRPPGGGGPRPTLLTAYGGFGASTPPAYSPAVTAWVRAGGAYATAAVRGGGEEGTDWHAAGSGVNKPNAIADFLSAARWLIDHGRTTPGRLAIRGASHSGFMVAAAITQAPDLFAAAVCSDAVTDMARYQHFGLGHLWTAEFGTVEDPEQCAALLSYSPYHRVRPGTPYPAVLLTCPRHDPRVDSLHTRKMTAALQHATGSGRPVLLRCEPDVGHGARSLDRWLGLQEDVLAFCAAHTGLVPPERP
ncbi:prolyl oligopeptidase family serine peptidase [Marinactinospora endophytica]